MTLWRNRGHHAKKRPRAYQLEPEERRRMRDAEHPSPEPRWR